MRYPVEIENIEEMRRREGIEDVELWDEIRNLQVGDFVKLTFLAGPRAAETLLVRITSIRGSSFRGKLANGPTSAGLSRLRAGLPVTFTPVHIHSLARKAANP